MADENAVEIATYDDVKAVKDNNDVLLIDVREPSELNETGIIPGSINIPLNEVKNALMNIFKDEFAERYGRPKPDFDSPLIFSCRAGRRGESASLTALKIGYKNVRNYAGGWLDWQKKSQQ